MFLIAFLAGYHCEYKMRTGRKPDGCAICFKTSKFSLISSNPVEFFRRDIPLLDRDNVGLVLLLQPRFHCKANAAICIANTHLLYNPRRGDIKLTQLAMLLAEIASVAPQKDGSFCPIILCGDFNSVPGSPLYRFIKEGKLNYEGLAIGKVGCASHFSQKKKWLMLIKEKYLSSPVIVSIAVPLLVPSLQPAKQKLLQLNKLGYISCALGNIVSSLSILKGKKLTKNHS